MGIIDSIKRRLPSVSYGGKRVFRGYRSSRRNFSAAATTNTTASWTTTPLSIDSVLRKNLKTLRARSREQSYNNDYAKRFVSMTKSNVIGPKGVVLRSQVLRGKAGADDSARTAIEGAWRRWGRQCDISGRLGWADMQRLILGTVAIDGEALIRVRKQAPNDFGFALEIVDPELLDTNYNDDRGNGHTVRMGIELDPDRRPVAYYFVDPVKSGTATYYANSHTRIPADEIFHLYLQEYPSQSRGVPWMSTALLRLNMLGGYEEAALVNARVGASKLGVIKTEDGDYGGDDIDTDGSPIVDGGDPGSWFQLRTGESIDKYDPTYPAGEFPDFVKSCLRGIASGLGVHYNILANDLEGVSYSSIRQAVIEDQEVWKSLQEWLVDSFMRPVYEMWLDSALLNGAIDINGAPLQYAGYMRYKRAAWQPRRWNWIDPLKDVNANIASIDNGLRSRSDVIREQGGDPEDVWAEIETENKLMAAHGVSIVSSEMDEPEDDDE